MTIRKKIVALTMLTVLMLSDFVVQAAGLEKTYDGIIPAGIERLERTEDAGAVVWLSGARIMKVDQNGTIVWSGGGWKDSTTTDGTCSDAILQRYAVIGSAPISKQKAATTRLYLSSYDYTGKRCWESVLGGDSFKIPKSTVIGDISATGVADSKAIQMAKVPRVGWMAAGTIRGFAMSDVPGMKLTELYLAKTDVDGNMLWEKRLGCSTLKYPDSAQCRTGASVINPLTIESITGEEYIMAVNFESSSLGKISVKQSSAALIRLNKSGSVVWQKFYGPQDMTSIQSVKVLSDGGFAMALRTRAAKQAGESFRVVRTDPAGNALWEKSLPDLGSGTLRLGAARDGGVWVAAETTLTGTDSQGSVIRMDGKGKELWRRSFGSGGIQAVAAGADSSVWAAGWRKNESGQDVLLLLRFDDTAP